MAHVNLRLIDDLHAALKKSAQSNHRSLNGEILFAISYYLAHAPEAQYQIEPAPEPPKPKRRKP